MPIAMSKTELARIKRWTQSDREDEDVVRRRAYLKHLDESSKEMCKDWPNSVEVWSLHFVGRYRYSR